VRSLSGGERNRLLLARLFARPANVLVLDEPTNDLDIDTLELLEDLLQNYAGTVFLVSHDRTFLDNVVTSTIVWEGVDTPGLWREYEGGVQDWLVQSARAKEIAAKAVSSAAATGSKSTSGKPSNENGGLLTSNANNVLSKKKLSFKEQRELENIPETLAALEAEQTDIRQQLNDASIYTRDPQRAADLHARDAAIDEDMLGLLERQEALTAA
jgi:ATP-binding cassette subfamily F protein uup